MTDELVSSLTCIAVAVYMAIGGTEVLDYQISIGVFLTTLSVCKDLASCLEATYSCLLQISEAMGPLQSVARFMNYDTDLVPRMQHHLMRSALGRQQIQELAKLPFGSPANHVANTAKYGYPYHGGATANPPSSSKEGRRQRILVDELLISIEGMSHGYTIDGIGELPISGLQNVSLSAQQGTLVAVVGKHGAGLTAFPKILAGVQFPQRGAVVIPSHLDVLYVPETPSILRNMSLLENLTFGCARADPGRVRRICARIDLSDELQTELVQAEQGHPSANWHRDLTQLDAIRIHIVRALVLNPEVLVFSRPVDGLDTFAANRILWLFREFVDHRGVELESNDHLASSQRRPRTLFFTGVTDPGVSVADVVWQMNDTDIREVFRGERPVDAGSGGIGGIGSVGGTIPAKRPPPLASCPCGPGTPVFSTPLPTAQSAMHSPLLTSGCGARPQQSMPGGQMMPYPTSRSTALELGLSPRF